MTYSQTGTSPDGTPLYTSTVGLSAANQQLLDTLQGTKTTAGTQGQNLIAGANYGAQQPGDVIGNATSGLVKDAMAKQVSYLDPYFTSQTSQLDAKLKNQGLNPGEPGYDNAMRALQNNQGNTVTGFESTMEPQMYQQAAQNYLMPAQLGGTLANFAAPTMPSWTQTPQLNVQPADYTGAVANSNQANMAAYNAQLSQNNAMMSGLFGTGSAVLGGMAQAGEFAPLLAAL
jgi:hypothetical protein